MELLEIQHMDKIYILYIMDYTKYIQSINDDVNNQNNQKLLSSNSNYHIEKHISHHNYDDKTKQNVLSKLKNIIDSTTAMKVFNYLVSNNLIDEFLASYDYLTTLRIYNPLTYTQIINYVIDYKKTNTEMDDILEEEINFLLDTRVSKKSLQSLRKRTNNPNSVRVLNKIIRNVPDKQSVKNMSSAKKELLIETLEQLPTQDDFEEKEDAEEQIQDVVNADASIPDLEPDADEEDILTNKSFNEVTREYDKRTDEIFEERYRANQEEQNSNDEEEEEEKVLIKLKKKKRKLEGEKGTEMERAFLQFQRRKAAEAEAEAEEAEAEQVKEPNKRKLEGEIEIEETAEEKETKKRGRTIGSKNRPLEERLAEKSEAARKKEEKERLKKLKEPKV